MQTCAFCHNRIDNYWLVCKSQNHDHSANSADCDSEHVVVCDDCQSVALEIRDALASLE